MDTDWMYLKDRTSLWFREGVENFLESIYADVGPNGSKKCPCERCYGRFYSKKIHVKDDLIVNGFMENYLPWSLHHAFDTPHSEIDQRGDTRGNFEKDDIVGMVYDAMGIPTARANQNEGEFGDVDTRSMDDETAKILKLLKDGQQPLFKGSTRFTSLSFITRLLHIKVLGGWSNKSCTLAMELFYEALEEIGDVVMAKSYYEANKLVSDLGFSYETWDACPNDCMMFRGSDESLENCSICGASRYKKFNSGKPNEDDNMISRKKIAAKQVRYFPLKPRLKRLFMSPHTSSQMTWHANERADDGIMRHPADSPAWKTFDQKNPSFGCESRNVRLGLASDGFNPFRTMTISHSTWPVVLIPYNLPPWLCMKQSSFILSVLIDGPKAPGDKIDVYLQLVIDELKELWHDGMDTYDASTKSMFKLRAALLWTISDFPAYAKLSGWSTQGKFACPSCNKKTRSFRLKHCRKFCYLGHRRWLMESHKLRRDKAAFNGEAEWDPKPKTLSGSELLEQLKDVETIYKKEDVIKKRKREELEKEKEKERRAASRREKRKEKEKEREKGKGNRKHKGNGKGKEKATGKGKEKEKGNAECMREDNWKKKSIFFELPYWEHLSIRHNLDVMHIEKNVCDNILFTLLGIAGKTKDHLNARLDLKEMKIRKPLHPQTAGSTKSLLPPARFTMGKEEKDLFLKFLKDLKVPDGYASNISRCVHLKERSIWGLKSHDNHIILQQLLPLAVRRILPKDVVEALIELSNFFRILCSKVNSKADLEYLQDRIALTLCHLEKIFPPSFFDIMEHLPIHLAEEALLAGPVQYRWMYPIERYLLTLKLYVRNRARPEGSIAKGALVEECMTFCARYLKDIETKSTRPDRNDHGEDNQGSHFGKEESFFLDRVSMEQAHRYILDSSDVVKPYKERHLRSLQKLAPRERQLVHNKEFPSWFRAQVLKEAGENNGLATEVKDLALGLKDMAKRYNGYIVNGFRFRTKRTDNSRVTQNSGVVLNADTIGYSSRKDKNPMSGDLTFYGELTDIIEVSYTFETKFVLFKCNWVDTRIGVRVDNFGITSVNFNHLLYKENKSTDEPFILACQAHQSMYIEDPIEPEWKVAIKMTSRDTFDMGEDENSSSTTTVSQAQPFTSQQLDERRNVNETDEMWVRNGVEGTLVEGRVPTEESQHENDRPQEAENEEAENGETDNECEDEAEVEAYDDFEEEEFDDMVEDTSDDMNDDVFAATSNDESDDI